MKKTTKAMLFSAFIFPGAGHLLFRYYLTGSLIFGIAAVCLYFVLSNAITRTLEVADQITRGEISPDIAIISEHIQQQISIQEASMLQMTTWVFIGTWLVGIIDCLRIKP